MQVIMALLNLWQDCHPGQMVALVPAKDRYQYEIIQMDSKGREVKGK